MQLPDFSVHAGLNRLRQKMGAALIQLDHDYAWAPIQFTIDTTGLDVSIEEIDISPDKSLEYQGQKVIVYIRDQYSRIYDKGGEYKFHLSHCQTLEEMTKRKRYSRYVVTTRSDGKFSVNLFADDKTATQSEKMMKVCVNCLKTLNLHPKTSPATFNIKQFFDAYSSKIVTTPKHTDETAPLNAYANDWSNISRQLRELKNWTCQECALVLTDYKEFLHVHHLDTDKSNNATDNLRVLCLPCHAEQPGHESMQSTLDYRRAKQLKRRLAKA